MSDLKPSASSPTLGAQGSPRTPSKKLSIEPDKSERPRPPVSPRGLTNSGGAGTTPLTISHGSPTSSQPGSPSTSLKRSASFRIPDENSQSWRTISMPNKAERRKSIIKVSETKKQLTAEDFLKEDRPVLEIWRPNMHRSTSLTTLTKAWKDGEDKAQGVTVSDLESALKVSIFDPTFYKRQRSDSLPLGFVFFSHEEEDSLVDYQEKLNAAPSVARIRKARDRGESVSNSSASGDTSMSIANGDLSSDDEEDIMREASETRLAAEGLSLPDDPFALNQEELTKRMTEEEKEDMTHIVVDDQGHIESGTLRALIRRLTSHLQEAEFLDSFMYTYDIFIDAYTLLKALILLYRCPITSSTPLQQTSLLTSSSSSGPSSLTSLSTDDSKNQRRSSLTGPAISIGQSRRPSMTDSSGSGEHTAPSPQQSPVLRGLSPKLPTKHQYASRSTGNLLELAKMKEEMQNQRLSGDDLDAPTWARPSANPLSPTSASTPVPEDPQQRQKVVLQFRIIKAIGRWIELRYEKLRHNKKWKSLFKTLTERLSQGTAKEKSWATNLIATRKEVQDQRKQIHKTIKASIISHPAMPSRPMEFLDLNPEELVKQMTLMDQRYFFNIKLKEYANKGWTRDECASLSPNLLKFIEHFNQNSYWVASTIILAPGCGEAGPKQRAAIITRFLQMMELFKELNNFNAIQQIFSALNMSCVERLKKAWSFVSPKHMKIFEEMGKFVSQSFSYKEYREYLEYRVQPPIIPLQEVILRDLFFIEENPNLDPDNNWVNFDKMAMLGKVFEQIRRCQRTPYKFKEDAVIQYYLAKRIILKETDLFIGSKTAEPKLDPQVEMKKREQEKKQRKLEKQNERAAEKAKKIEAKEEKKKKREQDLKKREKKAEVVQPPKPNAQKVVDDVLTDRKTYLEFEAYLKTKYAEENLEFYESVHNVFKKLNFDDKSPEQLKRIKEQSTKIYDKFVKNDAEFQVNIGEDTRETIVRVCQTSEQPTKELFDIAALEVKFNVLGPNFAEFIKISTK